ncbi:hypothetical protein BGZ76_007360, partial [Entomortierella beljakovae]
MAILSPPDMSDDARQLLDGTAKTCFINGCPPALQQMLKSYDISNQFRMSVHDLCEAAEQFDEVYNFSKQAQPSMSTGAQQFLVAQRTGQTSHSAPLVDPMAMEIDNLRLELNALRQQMKPTGSRSSLRSIPRLSEEERQRLYQRGACFRCRQDGHQARACPNRNG